MSPASSRLAELRSRQQLDHRVLRLPVVAHLVHAHGVADQEGVAVVAEERGVGIDDAQGNGGGAAIARLLEQLARGGLGRRLSRVDDARPESRA